MNLRDTLTSKWNPAWDEAPAFRRIRDARTLALKAWDAAGATEVKRAEFGRDGELSPKGIDERTRSFARNEAVPPMRRAAHMVDKVRDEIVRIKSGLGVPKPDPQDFAGAIRRMEMRNWMRGLGGPEVMALLMAEDADADLLAAAFEVPAAMSGLTGQMRDGVAAALIERRHAAELETLEDLQEAIVVVDALIQISASDLAPAVGFRDDNDHAFSTWMEAASAKITSDIEAEEAKGAPLVLDLAGAVDTLRRADKANLEKAVTYLGEVRLGRIGSEYIGDKTDQISLPDFAA